MSSKITSASPEIKELYTLALLSREKAYAPYSGHKVGAAIRTDDGRTYTGCNIENSSYGASNCAERVAVQKAISEKGLCQIAVVMVVTSSSPPWPPCGLCRQVLSEFGLNIKVYRANLEGFFIETTLDQLFPEAFTSTHLG